MAENCTCFHDEQDIHDGGYKADIEDTRVMCVTAVVGPSGSGKTTFSVYRLTKQLRGNVTQGHIMITYHDTYKSGEGWPLLPCLRRSAAERSRYVRLPAAVEYSSHHRTLAFVDKAGPGGSSWHLNAAESGPSGRRWRSRGGSMGAGVTGVGFGGKKGIEVIG